MSSSESDGEQGEQQQQQQLGSGKARAPNRHRFKRLAERIDEVSVMVGRHKQQQQRSKALGCVG